MWGNEVSKDTEETLMKQAKPLITGQSELPSEPQLPKKWSFGRNKSLTLHFHLSGLFFFSFLKNQSLNLHLNMNPFDTDANGNSHTLLLGHKISGTQESTEDVECNLIGSPSLT